MRNDHIPGSPGARRYCGGDKGKGLTLSDLLDSGMEDAKRSQVCGGGCGLVGGVLAYHARS